MDMPPSRYRVVEQGRRLVVIDSWSGEPVQQGAVPLPEMPGERRRKMEAPRALPSPARPGAAPEAAGRHAVSFVTAGWFDKEGPRRIRLSQDGQGQLVIALAIAAVVLTFFVALVGWIMVFPLAFVLLNPKVRDGFRTAATTWLTALDSSEA